MNNMSAATLFFVGILTAIGAIMWAATTGTGVVVAAISFFVGVPLGVVLALVWLRRHPRSENGGGIGQRH